MTISDRQSVVKAVNKDKKQIKILQTILFMIFWDVLMVDQIFLSPEVKRSLIISNKLVCTSCQTNCQTA